jgi:DNA modification methylase
MQKLNQIIQGDCIEIMKSIPDNTFDLIFADPPYYLQLPNRKLYRKNGTEVIPVNQDWDKFNSYEDYDKFTESWLKECKRVLKYTGTIWITGMYHNIFRVGKIMQDLDFWILNDIIWVKLNAMPNFNGRRFTNNHETIIWATKNKNCKNYIFNNTLMNKMNNGAQMKDTDWVFSICNGDERLRDLNGLKSHPTQKPLKLIQQIILASTKKGGVILDPFIGSGTTAIVSEALGRKWIGIEKDKTYFNLANTRIKNFIYTQNKKNDKKV